MYNLQHRIRWVGSNLSSIRRRTQSVEVLEEENWQIFLRDSFVLTIPILVGCSSPELFGCIYYNFYIFFDQWFFWYWDRLALLASSFEKERIELFSFYGDSLHRCFLYCCCSNSFSSKFWMPSLTLTIVCIVVVVEAVHSFPSSGCRCRLWLLFVSLLLLRQSILFRILEAIVDFGYRTQPKVVVKANFTCEGSNPAHHQGKKNVCAFMISVSSIHHSIDSVAAESNAHLIIVLFSFFRRWHIHRTRRRSAISICCCFPFFFLFFFFISSTKCSSNNKKDSLYLLSLPFYFPFFIDKAFVDQQEDSLYFLSLLFYFPFFIDEAFVEQQEDSLYLLSLLFYFPFFFFIIDKAFVEQQEDSLYLLLLLFYFPFFFHWRSCCWTTRRSAIPLVVIVLFSFSSFIDKVFVEQQVHKAFIGQQVLSSAKMCRHVIMFLFFVSLTFVEQHVHEAFVGRQSSFFRKDVSSCNYVSFVCFIDVRQTACSRSVRLTTKVIPPQGCVVI